MKERLRVCHITSVHSYFDERIFARECAGLITAGYEVHLLAADAPDKNVGGITLHKAPSLQGTFFRRLKETAKAYYPKAIEINAYVYHLHDPELLKLGKKLKAAGRIVIYDVRDNVAQEIRSDNTLSRWYRALAAYWFELFEMRAAKSFDVVIGADQYLRDRFHHQGCVAVDISDYPSLDQVTALKHSSKQERAVCYIGELSEECGLFEMLQAVQKADCKLLLVGKFVSPAEREQALAHPAWKQVEEYDGSVREQTLKVLDRAAAGLVLLAGLPKYMEIEPRQFGEYMSAGLPVICSDFARWKEVVEGYGCGVCVESSSAETVASRINALLSDQAEAKRLGENAAKLAHQRYTWENERKKLLLTYAQVLKPLEGEP